MCIGRRIIHSLSAAICGLIILTGAFACGDDNPAGGETPSFPEKVTSLSGDHPTISPDYQWLAFSRPEGGVLKCLLRTGVIDTLTAFGYEPDWAPAGDTILMLNYGYTSRYLITVSATTGDTSLVRGGGFIDGAVWSPDGTEIVARAADGLVAITYPGGDIAAIPCVDTDYSSCSGLTPCWSPGGQWIVFRDGTRLLRLPRDGGNAVVLLTVSNDLSSPRYSPDGRWIAFSMQNAGGTDRHLWAVDVSGAGRGLRQITFTDTTCHSGTCGDLDPYWSPDGKQIFFSSTRDGQRTIWRINFKS